MPEGRGILAAAPKRRRAAKHLPAADNRPARPPWAGLLDRCYERAEQPLPQVERLRPVDVPQPYRAILVHSKDMTPTLEEFFGQPPGLRVLSRQRQADAYYREVLLTMANPARPVLYGAIRICLHQLPPTVRRRVLAERDPLGGILWGEGIPHIGWPQDFFRAKADAHLCAVLELCTAHDLYGRRNVLLNGARHLLAEVIEVIAPVENPASSSRQTTL